MARNSKIEWTDHTANFWWGCTEVHKGCINCYAKSIAETQGLKIWGNNNPRRPIKKVWEDIFRWNAEAHSKGVVYQVFVNSMADFFEKPMPILTSALTYEHKWETTGDIRQHLFDNQFFEKLSNLRFLLLTKRPSNINKFVPESWKVSPPPNVAFGCTAVDQKTFNTAVPQLLEVKGDKFLSIEPQLEDIDILAVPGVAEGIGWIIQGGESGPNRRPFRIGWIENMQDQCRSNNIPYFMKQIDRVIPIPEHLKVRHRPFLKIAS